MATPPSDPGGGANHLKGGSHDNVKLPSNLYSTIAGSKKKTEKNILEINVTKRIQHTERQFNGDFAATLCDNLGIDRKNGIRAMQVHPKYMGWRVTPPPPVSGDRSWARMGGNLHPHGRVTNKTNNDRRGPI